MIFILTLFGLPALLLLFGFVYQAIGLRRDLRRFPPPGRLVDVAGSRLHLFELGAGSPAVILESGISASSLNWRRVQTNVAEFTRVCSYDRAGLGWSDLCDQPCTPSALAQQLHALLEAGGVSPPYILVGHSFGGLVVRMFAAMYPTEVSGLLLVDPLDPAEWTPISNAQRRTIEHGIRLSRRGAVAANIGLVRVSLNLLLAGNRLLPKAAVKAWSGRASSMVHRIAGQVRKMPSETWPWVAAHWMQAKCFEGMARHFECLPKSILQMQKVAPLAAPVALLVGAENEHPRDPRAHATAIGPRTKVIHATRSGHWIQLDEPDLVVSSIRELVEQARGVRDSEL